MRVAAVTMVTSNRSLTVAGSTLLEVTTRVVRAASASTMKLRPMSTDR
jgi:hypothetical protein